MALRNNLAKILHFLLAIHPEGVFIHFLFAGKFFPGDYMVNLLLFRNLGNLINLKKRKFTMKGSSPREQIIQKNPGNIYI